MTRTLFLRDNLPLQVSGVDLLGLSVFPCLFDLFISFPRFWPCFSLHSGWHNAVGQELGLWRPGEDPSYVLGAFHALVRYFYTGRHEVEA